MAWFAVTTLVSVVTLPVECDASRLALVWLESSGIAPSMEHKKAVNALFWAPVTFVTAVVDRSRNFSSNPTLRRKANHIKKPPR